MKYKIGDKVRIVSDMPNVDNFNPIMAKWLGKTVTIRDIKYNAYLIEEDIADRPPIGWCWQEDWISGLAEPEREPCTVELRFDGMITTATLKRGGRDVKTAEARCNPKDTYSRAEGARVAVERLFQKKRKEDKPKESKPKVGDKFVVTGNRPYGKGHHYFKIGSTVKLVKFWGAKSSYVDEWGLEQTVRAEDVRPYKEKSK